MWAAFIAVVAAGVSIDPACRTDYGAAVKWWLDEDGKLHIEDICLIEPPRATIETRLVPGSNPPRYESV